MRDLLRDHIKPYTVEQAREICVRHRIVLPHPGDVREIRQAKEGPVADAELDCMREARRG